MRNQPPATPHVSELLSAYIDNRLTPAERLRVGAHLPNCSTCSAELESLQATVALLHELPVVPAPRTFYIYPESEVAKRSPVGLGLGSRWRRLFSPGWAYGYLRLATSLAAVLLVVLVTADALTPFSLKTAAPSTRQAEGVQQEASAPPKPATPGYAAPSTEPNKVPAPLAAPQAPSAASPAPTQSAGGSNLPSTPSPAPPSPSAGWVAPGSPSSTPDIAPMLRGAGPTAGVSGSVPLTVPLKEAVPMPSAAPSATAQPTTPPGKLAADTATALPVPAPRAATTGADQQLVTPVPQAAPAVPATESTPDGNAGAPSQSKGPEPSPSPLRVAEVALACALVLLAVLTWRARLMSRSKRDDTDEQ